MNERILKVYYTYNKNNMVPMIRLQGDWLREAGFEIGQKLIVKVDKGEMEIKIGEEQ